MLENKERDHKLTEIATNVDIFYGANYVLVCKFFNQFQSC